MTSSPRTILFVTGNANKLKEVRAILLASTQHTENADPAATPAFSVESQDLEVPEVQGTTEEVAKAKVRAAADRIGGPCITEVRRLARLDALLSLYDAKGAACWKGRRI